MGNMVAECPRLLNNDLFLYGIMHFSFDGECFVKLRRTPEDFQVTELAKPRLQRGGQYSLYSLSKKELGTLEAIDRVLRAWNLKRGSVSYGGLKDTHAVTTQYLTVRHGPQRDLKFDRCSLEFQGTTSKPFSPQDIDGNLFQLVLRSMSDEEVTNAESAICDLQAGGLPNYFDDQRFGSVSESSEFIAAAWAKGNYERALWLTFADPNKFDRSKEKEQKRLLREHWGDWKACKATLDKSHRRSIITFLDDRPGDFRGAWARVRQDMRSLYIAALQSHLWNEILSAWLRRTLPPENLCDVQLKLSQAPFPTGSNLESLIPSLLESDLPLPSSRIKLDPGPIQDLVEGVLKTMGWEMRELRVKYPRDSFFSKGWRKAVILPGDLQCSVAEDDLSPNHKKMILQFSLPRGSYATILVKRITVAADSPDEDLIEEQSETEGAEEEFPIREV